MKLTPCFRLTLLIGGTLLATMRDAQAYIDPSSTSYFFQLLIAGFTAVVFFFGTLKQKVVQFFSLFSKRRNNTPENPLNLGETPDA